jgi:hypothetical protein
MRAEISGGNRAEACVSLIPETEHERLQLREKLGLGYAQGEKLELRSVHPYRYNNYYTIRLGPGSLKNEHVSQRVREY